MQDQYIEISSAIPANATLYGLGENAPSTGLVLRRDGIPYALWTRDQAPNVPNVNDYGAHPFIMDVRPGETSNQTLQGISCSMHDLAFPAFISCLHRIKDILLRLSTIDCHESGI